MSKLKPCPFCGGEARQIWIPMMILVQLGDIQNKGNYSIDCSNCRMTFIGGFKTEAEAIAAWNTRGDPAPEQPKVKIFKCKHFRGYSQSVPMPFGIGNCQEPLGDCAIKSESEDCTFDCPDYEEPEQPSEFVKEIMMHCLNEPEDIGINHDCWLADGQKLLEQARNILVRLEGEKKEEANKVFATENVYVCKCGRIMGDSGDYPDDYGTLGSESGICCHDCGNEEFETVKVIIDRLTATLADKADKEAECEKLKGALKTTADKLHKVYNHITRHYETLEANKDVLLVIKQAEQALKEKDK